MSLQSIPLRFDLASGSVRFEGAGPVVLAPVTALAELVRGAPPDAARSFARALGAHAAAEAARRAGGRAEVTEETPDDAVTGLATEVALLGLGSLWIERWGEAVVVVIEAFPLADTALEPFVSGLVGDFAPGVEALLLERKDARARLLLAGDEGREQVRELMTGGAAWADALARVAAADGPA